MSFVFVAIGLIGGLLIVHDFYWVMNIPKADFERLADEKKLPRLYPKIILVLSGLIGWVLMHWQVTR